VSRRAPSRCGPRDRRAAARVGAAGRSEGGAAAVEFALVAPVLLLLIFGIIEGGRLFSVYQGAVTASREGARQGSLYQRHSDCVAIRTAALARAGAARVGAEGITGTDVAVGWDRGPGTPTTPGCPPVLVNYGDRVVVTVTRPFTPRFPGFAMVPVSATDRRTITVPPP
jgi:Flp pilus assembly protein TadG